MKRILIITMAALLFAAQVFAWPTVAATSSGEKTADALIYTGGCALTAVQVVTDGTNSAKVVVYDGTDTGGTVVAEFTVSGTDHYGGRSYSRWPISCTTGIYVDVTGTGASYFVEYIKQQ